MKSTRRGFFQTLIGAVVAAPVVAALPAASLVEANPLLDEINATTLAHLYPSALADHFFRDDLYPSYGGISRDSFRLTNIQIPRHTPEIESDYDLIGGGDDFIYDDESLLFLRSI
jgi:hypothetical protein